MSFSDGKYSYLFLLQSLRALLESDNKEKAIELLDELIAEMKETKTENN